MDITPIRGEADYERALHRVEELWDSREGSAESDELDILTTLLEAYEREHYPVDLPDPVEAIKFRLEQTGKDSRALIGIIGGRTRVYEVMRGDRKSTRLNSSHGYISYAVFCLKKKKKNGRSTSYRLKRDSQLSRIYCQRKKSITQYASMSSSDLDVPLCCG